MSRLAAESFFRNPQDPTQRRYEALRAYYLEGAPAGEVAGRFGYALNGIYSLARNFIQRLQTEDPSRSFFIPPQRGRNRKENCEEIDNLIIELRKKYLSVPDIKAILDSLQYEVSEKYVFNVLKNEGFARLPRRSKAERSETFAAVPLEAPPSELLSYSPQCFQTQNTIGLLCLLPYIQKYALDKLIEGSQYPETKTLPRLNSVLSFVALKLSNVRRYTADDLWCMDRGLGLFAGLNVLPKAAWFTSYSHRVTRQMNLEFLKSLNQCFCAHGLLNDTVNLDFTTIPYWGDDSHLENNWSGTRHKALAGLLAVLAQDPDSGIITYGDPHLRHRNKSEVVVEFLDFYRKSGSDDLKYLVFDSKFTTYRNLRELDDRGVKFLTIRRRGKNIVERLNAIPQSERKRIRVPTADGKTRLLQVLDEVVFLRDYDNDIRQVSITGHGKIKPALIITNDFDLPLDQVVRKYARRWIVEKAISEQIGFFHLNRVSSSMVIKVDFDLTMTILAHNLYRLFAADLIGYSQHAATALFEKFMYNSGDVQITDSLISIDMKKKRHLPALLTTMEPFQNKKISWMKNRKFVFRGASRL